MRFLTNLPALMFFACLAGLVLQASALGAGSETIKTAVKNPQDQDEPKDPADGSDATSDWHIVARIGSRMVTRYDLRRERNVMIIQLQRQKGLSKEQRIALSRRFKTDDDYVLAVMLENELLAMEAKRRWRQFNMGENINEKHIAKEVEKYVEALGGDLALQQMGGTRAEIRDRLLEQARVDWLVGQIQKRAPRVTPADVRKAYQERLPQLRRERAYKLRVLLMDKTEYSLSDAEECRARLAQENADFAQMVEKFSMNKGTGGLPDPTREYLPHSDFAPELQTELQKMEEPGISDVIVGESSYCIIKLEGLQKAQTPRLAEVHRQLERILRQERLNEARLDFLRQLFEQSEIMIKLPGRDVSKQDLLKKLEEDPMESDEPLAASS